MPCLFPKQTMPPHAHTGFNAFNPQYGHMVGTNPHLLHHHPHHPMGDSHFAEQGIPGGINHGGLMYHPHHELGGHQHQQHNMQQAGMGESLAKSCARSLRAFGMRWSQDAMQARSWKAASRMIDMYTHARTSDDVVRWHEDMKMAGCEPSKATCVSPPPPARLPTPIFLFSHV